MWEAASAGAEIHIWQGCHHCDSKPIVGNRYHCLTCPAGPDSDLCERCYQGYKMGTVTHPVEDHYALKNGRSGTHQFHGYEGAPEESFVGWLAVRQTVAVPPRVPDHAIVRPEFCVKLDSYFGGHAFSARIAGESRPLLLTALHVMDELIKDQKIDAGCANESYSGEEVPAVLTRVRIYDLFQQRWMLASLGEAGPMLVLPGARVDGEEPVSHRDIAAFRLPDSTRLHPFELADEAPRLGDPVWLAARLESHNLSRLAKAVVVECNDRSLIYRFDQNDLSPKYTSGAPILDRRGRVAGINVGGGRFREQEFGHANHVANIRRHLAPFMNSR